MILDFFVLLGGLILGGFAWHIGYTRYKEREWKRNNPDEFNFMNNRNKK